MQTNTDRLKEVLAQARQEVAKVIIGQSDVIDKALIAIFTPPVGASRPFSVTKVR